jgi:mercuric ion transport protein
MTTLPPRDGRDAALAPPRRRGASRIADAAGVAVALFAALCCVGVPLIVGVLSAIGLSFLRTDAILMPLLAVALVMAFWGFIAGRRAHGTSGPLILGVLGGVALVVGVRAVRWFVWVGAALLIGATIWNVAAGRRSRCTAPTAAR